VRGVEKGLEAVERAVLECDSLVERVSFGEPAGARVGSGERRGVNSVLHTEEVWPPDGMGHDEASRNRADAEGVVPLLRERLTCGLAVLCRRQSAFFFAVSPGLDSPLAICFGVLARRGRRSRGARDCQAAAALRLAPLSRVPLC